MTSTPDCNHYDDDLARLYDHSPLLADGAGNPAADYFRQIAKRYGGPVLQIGVATGQFALPIARDGIDVVGVDISESMLSVVQERLAAEPAGVRDRVTVRLGDMRDLDLGTTYPLIIMPGNVFFYNLSQHDQVATLVAMRRHLDPDGVLVIEAFTVDRHLLASPTPVVESRPFECPDGARYLAEQTATVDALNQRLSLRMTHRRIQPGGQLGDPIFTELTMRYAYPAEMVLLLRLARLKVHQLAGDYTSNLPKSTYEGPQLVIAGRAG